jgi:hypothetical protein
MSRKTAKAIKIRTNPVYSFPPRKSHTPIMGKTNAIYRTIFPKSIRDTSDLLIIISQVNRQAEGTVRKNIHSSMGR